jgi:SAM-dependent methyltransferase
MKEELVLNAFRTRWRTRINRLMRVKPVCNAVFWVRYFWLVRICRSLRAFQDLKLVTANGFEHNEKAILQGQPSDRILKLILPLSVLDILDENSRILAIGVRYETDLLYLSAYGFSNTRGLDLFSYSPWVDLGNMHNLPYANDSFDATIMGWTLAYSDDPVRAASEIIRVTKNGGVVGISNTYYPKHVIDTFIRNGEPMGLIHRRQTVVELLELFKENVKHVYFRHDSRPDKQGACVVIFSLKK